MPIYEYRCAKCGLLEKIQAITARALRKCPKCKGEVEKVVSLSSFRLKGGGWEASGYQK